MSALAYSPPVMFWAAGLCFAAAAAQEDGSSAPWYQAAARAERLLQCSAPDRSQIRDPAAAASALLKQAIAQASESTGDPELRGAFRALTTKQLDALETRQTAWTDALARAQLLEKRASLDQAMEVLVRADPLECDGRFRESAGRLQHTLAEVRERMADGVGILVAARSSFGEARVARLARDAAAQFRAACSMNVDNRTASAKLLEATELAASMSAIDKHDVIVFSNPGSARVVIKGEAGEEDRVCAATPCKFRFESYQFDRTGGMFLTTKRRMSPIAAQIEKQGHLPASLLLTKKAQWSASVPGAQISIDYYYFAQTRFEVSLQPLRIQR